MVETCTGLCDYCFPDVVHACVRPVNHRGPHSCQFQDEDLNDG